MLMCSAGFTPGLAVARTGGARRSREPAPGLSLSPVVCNLGVEDGKAAVRRFHCCPLAFFSFLQPVSRERKPNPRVERDTPPTAARDTPPTAGRGWLRSSQRGVK